jgi:photosystem II stability/assembly factor-like uncharacterized protein
MSPRLLSGLLPLLLLFAAPTATSLADTTDVLRWEQVGHIAEQPIEWLAVPPDGLASGILFARAVDPRTAYVLNSQVTSGTTRRSLDAGKTWETVADAPGRVVLPPSGSPAFSLAKDAVYRSTDAGMTWAPVASVGAAELLFSPGFGRDGVLFLRGGDQLWRSSDAGLTWTNVDPGGGGQAIVSARLSPAFGSDRTLFAGAVSARPTSVGRGPLQPPPTDNVDSLGLLISTDAGSTWSSLSDGLQIDGDPYRQVLDVAVSPNFASDQTLYVSSLGPWQTPDDSVNCPRCAAGQVLTQSFVLRGASPSQSICELAISTDAGDSWQALPRPGESQAVCDVGAVDAAGSTAILAYRAPYYLTNEPNRNIEHSLDGGATWTPLSPPGDGLAPGFQSDLEQRQVLLPDRVFQATQKGDLWQYAPLPACATQPTLGFGQVWAEHADWQDAAGCPTGPEQPIQVQSAHKDVADTYWTTDGTVCVEVRRDTRGGLHATPASAGSCTGPGDVQFSGARLPLANNQYWLYIADAPDHGLIVSTAPAAAVEVTPE